MMEPEMPFTECVAFLDQIEDLAFGDLAEPDRSRLLTHAASCPACRDQLDALLALGDGLLLLAPQHEAPPGFETRVLERISASTPMATAPPGRARTTRRWWLEAAAAIVLVAAAAAGGVALFGRTAPQGEAVVRSGVIVGGSGARSGSIDLVDGAHPYVLVTIDHPQQRNQEVYCQLVLADGRTVTVGSWGYDDVRANVWAVGIDAELLRAVSMQVVTEDGAIVATAALAEA